MYFSVEDVFKRMLAFVNYKSFSCSHTKFGFVGEIVMPNSTTFTTDDIRVVESSFQADSLDGIAQHCAALATAMSNRPIE